MTIENEPCIAIKGLVGWHVKGRRGEGTTYSCGPYYRDDDPRVLECPYQVDMSGVYQSAEGIAACISGIWKRPNLDLDLPDRNVRGLFEGCIGCAGSVSGHPWDGRVESLQSTDSVGLLVYLEVLRSAGGKFVKG